MLVVRESNSLPLCFVDQGGDAVTAHGELRGVRDLTWKVDHRDLAFVGLTDPPLLRKLLDVAYALARRVHERQRDERPETHRENRNPDDRTDQDLSPMATEEALRRRGGSANRCHILSIVSPLRVLLVLAHGSSLALNR